MGAVSDVCVGRTDRLRRPVAATVLTNLVNVVPFCLSVEVVAEIFRGFGRPGGAFRSAYVWQLVFVLLVYVAVMVWAERRSYRASFRGAYEVSAEGRLALAEHLRRLPLGRLLRYDPGDLSSMMITDFMMAETGISHHLPQLLGALAMPLLAFACLLWVDWRMALAMFAALPLSVLVLWGTSLLQRRLSGRQIAAKVEAGNRMEEYLKGLRVMKAYGLVGARFVRLREAFAALRRAAIRQEALLGPLVLLSVTMLRAGLTFMVLCGTYLLAGGRLSVSVFVLFLVVGSRVFDPLTTALTQFVEFRYYAMAGGRILRLMREPVMPGQARVPAGGDLVMEHVAFGYGDKEVLHDVSLTFRRGTMTALVGPSGSGKSTLLKLAARFYDPDGGRVVYGGQELLRLDPEDYMQHVSMVFQNVCLFHDTVRNNIRFGRPDATDAEVEDAARRAACGFVSRLPGGLDAVIGEGGCTLSGGERQRISIARALLRDAPLVLLDEATASLDPENEAEVQRAVSALVAGHTLIVVAHRLKTICRADNIVVMDGGRVVEQGKHEDLLRAGGLYARLWRLQATTDGWRL